MKKLLATVLLLSMLLVAAPPVFAGEEAPAAPPVFAGAGQTPSGIPFTEMEERIDAIMNEHIGVTTPGAAVVVVHEGGIIFSGGYGWADIENQVPVDPAATVFEYGSISKAFVWASVMQLAEQGLLDIDADVCDWLPDSFVFEEPFTMRDLMNHSAGFEDFLLGMFLDVQAVGRTGSLEESLLASQPAQIYVPGTLSAYSNWGAALAAFIVERVSGQDYAAFERGNILHPLNMNNTLNQPDWFGDQAFLAGKAKGYFADGEGGFSEGMWTYAPLYPAGGMYGTAEDLAAFIIALMPPAGDPGRLFGDAGTYEALLAPSSNDPENNPGTYHGLMSYPGALPAFGHGGGTAAFRTDFVFVPETRFGYALLTNGAGQDLLPLMHGLLIGGAQLGAQAETGSLPDAAVETGSLPDAAAVEGRYLPARRYGKFLEFFSYAGMSGVPMLRISALDENKIQVSAGALGSAAYVQTGPYVFSIDDPSASPDFAYFYPQMRFQSGDGPSWQIHMGNGTDFTSLPAGRTMPFLVASLVIVALCGGFFLVTPIVLFAIFLIRRKKRAPRTRFDRFSTGFLLSGTVLALNNLLLFARFGVNPFFPAEVAAPHIWLNYVFAALAALLFAGSVWSWRTAGEAGGKGKALFVITTVFAVLLVAVLHNWQFFVLL
ncbi:MAG: beta-lactamase family protein [Clostridiales bacterium]|nr:beta-lactamase family protein [Clostridiales bacterium]